MENIKEIAHSLLQAALLDTVVLSIQIYLLVCHTTQSNLNACLHELILHRPLLLIISASGRTRRARNGKVPLQTSCLWSHEF